MSCKELINSLKKAADEKVLAMRKEAEQEADAARADVARRLEQRRNEATKKESEMLRDATARALSAAKNRVRGIRLVAEKDLSIRLEAAAAASLSALRNGGYEVAFGKMARELPAHAWHAVRVNPGDVGLAKKYFPGAEIVTDGNITGGMDVSTKDGSIRIINTFEKRLERAWGDMLPLLIRDVYGEVSDGAPAAS